MPSLNSLATMSLALTDATGSGADIVRVKIQRASGSPSQASRAPGRQGLRGGPDVAVPARVPSGDRPMHSSDEGLT